MRHTYIASLILTLATGCSSGVGTNAGSGTRTLLVRASVSADSGGGATEMNVHVEKGGQNLDTAKVRLSSGLGAVDLVSRGGGDYRATQPGYADGYIVEVTVVDANNKVTDELRGSVVAPDPVRVTAPDLTRVVDARALPNNVLVLTWAAPGAESARVKLKGYDSGARTPDPLRVDIPATSLKEQADELEIRRSNSIALAGGLPGSELSVEYKLKTTLFVMNPF